MNNQFFRWILILPAVLCAFFSSRTLLHYFQLESYQFPGYFRTVKRNWRHSLFPGICAAVWTLLTSFLFGGIALLVLVERETDLLLLLAAAVYCAICVGGGLLIARLFTEKKAKKKFVYTARVKRLLVVIFWSCY